MTDFKDQVYIITGSSRGIGRATAETLAARGAKVVVSSRNRDACQQVADAIIAEGGEALVISCHIGEQEQLENLIDSTVAHFGRLDGLVCNAASNPVFGPSSQVDYQAFEVIMRNNVYSAQKLAFLAAEHMPADGAVVLVSSIAGIQGSRMIGTYGLSKAAQIQLVKNLALELGPAGVRVNGVAPGLIATDFSKALLEHPGLVERVEQQTALGRVGEAMDIATVIAFLLSSDAGYITGQTLIADGGALIADPF